MHVILASRSPRRADLLRDAGLSFEIWPAEVDESRLPGEDPSRFVERVARLKARAVAAHRPSATIVGADTAVVVGEDVLGKPEDEVDAARMLRALSGHRHVVLTGVAVMAGDWSVSRVESTTVWFSHLTSQEITEYVASGEPMDKAGAYAIQGRASRFIPRIEGSYTNVVGLPVATVFEMLKAVPSPAAVPRS